MSLQGLTDNRAGLFSYRERSVRLMRHAPLDFEQYARCRGIDDGCTEKEDNPLPAEHAAVALGIKSADLCGRQDIWRIASAASYRPCLGYVSRSANPRSEVGVLGGPRTVVGRRSAHAGLRAGGRGIVRQVCGYSVRSCSVFSSSVCASFSGPPLRRILLYSDRRTASSLIDRSSSTSTMRHSSFRLVMT
jgi:hypothetical protein